MAEVVRATKTKITECRMLLRQEGWSPHLEFVFNFIDQTGGFLRGACLLLGLRCQCALAVSVQCRPSGS